ncbi:antitoxin of toxin-antitoxin stability system [Candidatus Thiosymbion oneisti]|uniref:antitoxin of toxin-antitoxin stability system n=1 Tax=Candidatus Thiosymbion oneisti TaxID=589554 RepID=UPI00106047BF|nr:antitoxin of toxin-antitoxin stability system [Candidatus Thiosymbion oneisti]
MQAIEFETRIDEEGQVRLPEEFHYAYGRLARLVILLPESTEPLDKRRRPGSAKGILKVLSEDDEHLNDFRDYMR